MGNKHGRPGGAKKTTTSPHSKKPSKAGDAKGVPADTAEPRVADGAEGASGAAAAAADPPPEAEQTTEKKMGNKQDRPGGAKNATTRPHSTKPSKVGDAERVPADTAEPHVADGAEGASGVAGAAADSPPAKRLPAALHIWYRHSGEEAILKIPYKPTCRTFQNEREITADIGNHHITHMVIENGVIPQLDVIAPNLTHLKIEGVNKYSQLQCLSQLHQLKDLDLSENNFSAGLPAVIREVNSLNVLSLWGCQLTTLPESLSKLTQLRELYLDYNYFFGGLPAVIGEINSLNVLKLSGCHLTTFPESMSQLNQLKKLDLDENNFSAGLPAVIGEISSLNELELRRCKLTTLPESMAQLSQLKKLDLDHNKFSAGLPAVIGEISSLNELELRGCKLTTLPESMSQLNQLSQLYLHDNNFSAGLPAVIGEISSLNELHLYKCDLTTLPEKLGNLKQLRFLYLQGNQFEQLPSVIYSLSELEILWLPDNRKLVRIDDDLLHLTKLTNLHCELCCSLVYPPYAVCQQGLTAVRKFFNDIKLAKGIEKTVVPVAIIGQSMSGKSSLVKSLKTGKRTLTYRKTNSPLDETTKVFQVQDLQLPSSQLKLIDFGGNDVYHVAYRMMIKDQYLPLVVVNLEEFSALSSSVGSKEATRQVCMNWMAHLYLACPRLGRPILVITHADKLSSEDVKSCIKELLAQAEAIRQDVLDEERVHQGSFQAIVHLSNTQAPLFAPEDIFEFSNDTTTTSNIQSLKNNLEGRSKEFNVVIPRLWEELASSVHGHTDTPYMSISDIAAKFSGEDCLVILRYMHNIGDILWFEKIDGLKGYLFHQLPAITEMVTVLFDHCSDGQWKTRLSKFIPFFHGNQLISKDKCKKLIKEFIHSGVIDKALLIHILETESKFPSEVALELLKGFCIVHGPMKKKTADDYVIPFFAPSPKDDSWKADGTLQLRLDIILGGMTLPKYVHQLITVAVLNATQNSTNTVKVANNGATIYHGENTTHLVHDFVGRMVTLQISTPVELLGESWKHLVDTTTPVFSLLSQEWKACHASFKFYCSHCLFLKDPNPDFDINPSWFFPIYNQNGSEGASASVHTESFQGIQPVTCSSDAVRRESEKPSVPKPLKFPCFHLTMQEINLLKTYLLEESRRYRGTIDVGAAVGETRAKLQPRGEQEGEKRCTDVEGQRYSHLSSISRGFLEVGPLTENVASSFASTVNIQSTSTAAGNIQSVSAAAGSIRSSSTVADVDGETSYGLNFDLELGGVRETGDELSDVEEQRYCEPSSTSIGGMKVGQLTENVASSVASTANIQATSTASGNIQSTSTASGNIQFTSTAAGNIQSTSTAAGIIQSTSTASGNIQCTSTAAGNIQSTSTAAGNIQSTSTAAGNIQSTSTAAGNIQSTSTAADVDGETSYSLNFDLEPRGVRDSGSEVPDVDEQRCGYPSSTYVGDLKVGSQTGNTTSSFTTTDTIHSTSTAAGASGLVITSTETATSGDTLEFIDDLCDIDNNYQPPSP